jgi:hypothetical protein
MDELPTGHGKPGLLEVIRRKMRLKRLVKRAKQTYLGWLKDFLFATFNTWLVRPYKPDFGRTN